MKIKRFINYFFIISLLSLSWLPIISLNAQEYEYDLGFTDNSDVWLSEEILIIGDSVRLYARVHNFGSEDNTGYVTFYQGTALIGESQVVTVLPGLTDDVWTDLVIPDTDFNILARIMGIYPLDENTNNNEAVTTMFSPDYDSDGDGIPDSEDPENDNLSDEEESQLNEENGVEDEQDEPKDIFAPIDFSQINNNENTNIEIDISQTNENKNVNANFNLNINNLNLPEGQDFKNIRAKIFFSLKNIWLDLILILIILIIISFIYLAYKNRENEKESLRSEFFSIKESKPITTEKRVEDIVPIKEQKNIKRRIKVKKISNKSPRSRKSIGVSHLTEGQKDSRKNKTKGKEK